MHLKYFSPFPGTQQALGRVLEMREELVVVTVVLVSSGKADI